MLDQCGALGVEDVRFQRRHGEDAVRDALGHQAFQLRAVGWIACKNQPVQLTQGVRQIGGVFGFVHAASHMFGQVTQAFERVCSAVAFRFHRRIAEVRFGFDEQQEQQSVHVAQTLHGQFGGVDAVHVSLFVVRPVMDDFVAQDFHAFAQRGFQTFRHGDGLSGGFVVERVEHGFRAFRAQARTVQEHGDGIEDMLLAAGVDGIEVEQQALLLPPLTAVNQHGLMQSERKPPARRFVDVAEQRSYRFLAGQ